MEYRHIAIVLFAIAIAGSGCVNDGDKPVEIQPQQSWMLLDHLGYLEYNQKDDAIYKKEVKFAYEGVYINKDGAKVWFVILNFDNNENATRCLKFLEEQEKRNPDTDESSENISGVEISRFSDDSGIEICIWRVDNAVFRFWSDDGDTLEVVKMHTMLSLDEAGLYLERVDLSIGGFWNPAFQIEGDYKTNEGKVHIETSVFGQRAHAKSAYDNRSDHINSVYDYWKALNESELNELKNDIRKWEKNSRHMPENIWEQTEDTITYTTMDNTFHADLKRNNYLIEFRFTGMSEEVIKNILSKFEI